MSGSTESINLRVRLKGYHAPSTGSEFEGWVEPGRHILEEYRENFPDADTDYARLLAPTLGAGDTWICARWRDQRYADVAPTAGPPAAQPASFAGDPMAIPESALTDLLPGFHAFRYDLDQARYPTPLPGCTVPVAPPNTNNCCTFVEALLVAGWARAQPSFAWSAARHRQMMIMSSDDFFSPVTAAIESGIAAAVPDPDTAPAPWTIIQGWRHQWRSGHTFLIVDHDTASDRVLTLESNSGYELDGVGCRKLGNLRDLPGGRPPAGWRDDGRLWTWETIRATYRFRQQAALKVTDLHWSP